MTMIVSRRAYINFWKLTIESFLQSYCTGYVMSASADITICPIGFLCLTI